MERKQVIDVAELEVRCPRCIGYGDLVILDDQGEEVARRDCTACEAEGQARFTGEQVEDLWLRALDAEGQLERLRRDVALVHEHLSAGRLADAMSWLRLLVQQGSDDIPF